MILQYSDSNIVNFLINYWMQQCRYNKSDSSDKFNSGKFKRKCKGNKILRKNRKKDKSERK